MASNKKTSIDYLENCEQALKQNLLVVKESYKYEFYRLWKDFEYGLNDFQNEKITTEIKETYKKRLMKIWNSQINQGISCENGK